MRFLKISIIFLLGFIVVGCSNKTVDWVNLSEYVRVRTISQYTDGEYLKIRIDFSENNKNPVYALGQEAYDQRLAYFNSTIVGDLEIINKNGSIQPFDIHTERNFGYKNYLTVLFFFSVSKEELDDIEYIRFSDNCFGIGKVKLQFELK